MAVNGKLKGHQRRVAKLAATQRALDQNLGRISQLNRVTRERDDLQKKCSGAYAERDAMKKQRDSLLRVLTAAAVALREWKDETTLPMVESELRHSGVK